MYSMFVSTVQCVNLVTQLGNLGRGWGMYLELTVLSMSVKLIYILDQFNFYVENSIYDGVSSGISN